MPSRFHNDWDQYLKNEWNKAYFKNLVHLLKEENKNHTIYPKKEDVFKALRLVSYEDCKVVILGQDPYHGPGQANGLAFSVNPGISLPPSLRNIYKELEDDLAISPSNNGDLSPWANQGVLLLNASLTVRAGDANSHASFGWQNFTDEVIRLLGKKDQPLVFVLWGNFAQSKEALILEKKHLILKSSHPSPLSAYRGFFGSKPFSKINTFLKSHGKEEIDWKI